MSKISIGSDHAGFELKQAIIAHLRAAGHTMIDFGTNSTEPVDYPDFIRPAAECVARGDADFGIVLGGSGNGEAIAANKVHGIRCALCWTVQTAQLGRQHNNANVISIGARMVSQELALQMVDAWLGATFEGGRHIQRLAKIEKTS